MKEGNYCLYTCGRCPSQSSSSSSGSTSSSDSGGNNQGGGDDSGSSSEGFAKPGDPTVCDDVAPNGQYTCAQQVRMCLQGLGARGLLLEMLGCGHACAAHKVSFTRLAC